MTATNKYQGRPEPVSLRERNPELAPEQPETAMAQNRKKVEILGETGEAAASRLYGG